MNTILFLPHHAEQVSDDFKKIINEYKGKIDDYVARGGDKDSEDYKDRRLRQYIMEEMHNSMTKLLKENAFLMVKINDFVERCRHNGFDGKIFKSMEEVYNLIQKYYFPKINAET